MAKAFDNADYEGEKFEGRNRAYVSARQGVYPGDGGLQLRHAAGHRPAAAAGPGRQRALCLWGRIDIGDFAAFLLYISMFTNPIRRLNQFVEMFQDGMSGFERFAR